MKKVYTHLLCAVSISLISVDICSAQATPGTLALNAPKAAVVIDGSSQEWGDSLSYYNAEKKVHYSIANDKTTLYLVVKTKDPVQITNITKAGLTFSVDTKGRKKSAFSTTFPYTDPASSSMAMGGQGMAAGEQTQQQKAAMALFITKFKKIKVDGFKDIAEDDLGTTNPYNIMVAINYDADGSLVYEESLPLELFRAGDLAKGEWSFNIKMNGVEPPSSQAMTGDVSGAPNGKGGKVGAIPRNGGSGTTITSGTPQQKPVTTPTIDFWGKFTLAK